MGYQCMWDLKLLGCDDFVAAVYPYGEGMDPMIQ